MIGHRSLPAIIASGLALVSALAAADDPSWAIRAEEAGDGSMIRTVDNVTLAYTRHSADNDTLRITVSDCGDDGWYMEDGINTVTADSLRKDIAEEFQNARLNCKLANGVEDRIMAGFDEAFARVKPILPPHRETIAGWQLSDEGGLPGDDSERVVKMVKALAAVTMTYRPVGTSDGASIELKCDGASYGGGFDFGNPPEDHLKVINGEMAEDYADFVKDCKGKPEALAVVMQDFPQALATLEAWMKAKPFVYPPETPSSEQEQ